MTPSTLFLLGLALTLVSALTIVVYLRRPLHNILVELCGNRERAGFWVSFANVTIALVPLIFAMQYTPEMKAGPTPVLELAAQLKWALAGLLVAVLILGAILSTYIRQQPLPDAATRQSPAPAA